MKTCLALRRIINPTYRSICSIAERDIQYSVPSFSAILQTLGLDRKTIPKVDDPLYLGRPYSQGSHPGIKHSRGFRKAVYAAPGLHVSETTSSTLSAGPLLQRQFNAHAAPLEEEERQENPGFIAGNYNVEQFPPELVHAPPTHGLQ